MAGDSTLFAREDYVEQAWRIVEPVPEEQHAGFMSMRPGPGVRSKRPA